MLGAAANCLVVARGGVDPRGLVRVQLSQRDERGAGFVFPTELSVGGGERSVDSGISRVEASPDFEVLDRRGGLVVQQK